MWLQSISCSIRAVCCDPENIVWKRKWLKSKRRIESFEILPEICGNVKVQSWTSVEPQIPGKMKRFLIHLGGMCLLSIISEVRNVCEKPRHVMSHEVTRESSSCTAILRYLRLHVLHWSQGCKRIYAYVLNRIIFSNTVKHFERGCQYYFGSRSVCCLGVFIIYDFFINRPYHINVLIS